MTATVTRADMLDMLVAKLGEVLDIDPSGIEETARFDEDLHADSLDLVEVIEGVEARLRSSGVDLRLPEDELAVLRTVGEAVDRLMAASTGAGP